MSEDLKKYIKSYPDFPIKGIDFKCTASLCSDPKGFSKVNHDLADKLWDIPADKVIGLDARGFLFASVYSYMTSIPLVLARKAGKLPSEVTSKLFELEYGSETIEIQSSSISKGDRVIIMDDLLATGGTVNATIDIVEELGGIVVAVACVMNLSFLQGAKTLEDRGIPFVSSVTY